MLSSVCLLLQLSWAYLANKIYYLAIIVRKNIKKKLEKLR